MWTWIFGDTAYTPSTGAIPAAAPLGAAHIEDADAPLGNQPQASSTTVCLPAATASASAAPVGGSEGVTAETVPWVMKTPSMVLDFPQYNGIKTVSVLDPGTGKYTDEQVLDFTMPELTISSMVTYSIQNGQTVYNNAGSGTTTTLIKPHLMVREMIGDILGIPGLGHVDWTPENPPPALLMPPGITLPLPIPVTNVTTVLAYLNISSISIPGFKGFSSPGVASPQ